MMDKKRLIYADDALAAEFTIEEGSAIGYVVDSEVIRCLPTVDAVEVVHARWVDVRELYGDYMCSNCKELSRTKTYNYCPDCGAKMDGERKE